MSTVNRSYHWLVIHSGRRFSGVCVFLIGAFQGGAGATKHTHISPSTRSNPETPLVERDVKDLAPDPFTAFTRLNHAPLWCVVFSGRLL